MPRIIIVRHGEEPTSKSVKDIQSEIGLTLQGAVRAYLMPNLIKKLFGDKPFELHTYSHNKHGKPTSRSYYTSQLLHLSNNTVIYDKSDEIDELVKGINNSKADNIVVCWEHSKIPVIINGLINTQPDYNECVQNIASKLNEKKVSNYTVQTDQLNHIQRCDPTVQSQNETVKYNHIDIKKDLEYALVWDVEYKGKHKSHYDVYPNYLITPNNDTKDEIKEWLVHDYT